MTKRIINILKWSINIAFLIGVICVAVYPVHNQDVHLVVDTYAGSRSITLTYAELNSGITEFEMEYPDFDKDSLKEIRIYRSIATVCVDKITADKLDWQFRYEDGKLIFGQDICEQLLEDSKSYFSERIILAEVLLIIVVALQILLNAMKEKMDPDNHNNHGPIYETRRFCGDIRKYWKYMVFAANADLKAEVANSYLNRLWWLLEPLFSMLVYVIVFGRVMGNSIQNYATFIFSALLMWNYFNKTIMYSVKCVRNNRDIITKVYVPKHVLLISNMILNMFKLFFSLIILVPMLFIFKVHIGIGILWVIPAYVLMITISFAGGMILLHYGVYVDDLSYAVGILLQMMMFLSGIFYDTITSLPVPLNNVMLCLNPVAMFIDAMRNALLNNVVANVPLVILWFIISLLFMYVGIHIVYKNENGYVKVV